MVRLLVPGRTAIPVRVDDLSIQGALLRVPSEEAPLRVGSVVRLDLIGPKGQQLDVAARVVRDHVDEHGVPRGYGLMFLERSAIEARLTPEFARLFNRRRVPRLAVGDLQVVIAARDTRWLVGVVDLSSDAVALDADMPAAPLADGDPVELRLRLPGSGDLRLGAVLRTRSEGDAGTRVVAHLDRDDENEEARAAVSRYVEASNRQRS